MNNSKKLIIAAAISLSACLSGFCQTAPTVNVFHPLNPASLPVIPDDLKALIAQLQTQAGQFRALATGLREQLAGKTAEERRAIIEQFRKDHADLLDAQRALARQIRAEMKLLRQQRRGTG